MRVLGKNGFCNAKFWNLGLLRSKVFLTKPQKTRAYRAVATFDFEATEASAVVVFTTVAVRLGDNNIMSTMQLNFTSDYHDCRNS